MKISIDTRTIKRGEYFVPIKGPNFDGNRFIDEALKKGARGIISEEEFYRIAKERLIKRNPIIIAVAGSIGKSTFRSYLTSILKTKYPVLEGDQNTKLGLSLSIVNKLNKQKILVAEVGIDRLGEMENTSKFISPDFSVITKLGKEHLEFLKSYKNVVIEESKILDNTKYKKIFVNSNDLNDYKKYLKSTQNLIFYDTQKITNTIKKALAKLILPPHDIDYLKGIYFITKNYFNFSDKGFINTLKKLKKPKGRFNILKHKNGSIIINDTYNAVCDQTIIEGVKFAQVLSKKFNKKLIVVVPNMVENGESMRLQHKNVSNFINNIDFVSLYIVGDNLSFYKKYLKVKYFEYKSANLINIHSDSNSLYYIKATRRYKGPELVKKLIKL